MAAEPTQPVLVVNHATMSAEIEANLFLSEQAKIEVTTILDHLAFRLPEGVSDPRGTVTA